MAQAYQQLPVILETVAMLAMNILKGLHRVRYLPFGVTAAPAIFHRFMETTLSGIPGTCTYLNDIIIISGAAMDEHASRLEVVQYCLKTAHLRLIQTKCKSSVPEVSFLGNRVNAAGIHTTRDNVRAIVEAPPPTSQLARVRGTFLILRLISEAVSHGCQRSVPTSMKGCHLDLHQQAFKNLNQLLLQRSVLAHYNPAKPLVILCDASPYSVGAGLTQEDSWYVRRRLHLLCRC